MQYRCNDCEAEFEQPAYISEKHGLTEPPYETRLCCPNCHSEDYDDLIKCRICGGQYKYLEMSDYDDEVCEECSVRLIKELLTVIATSFSSDEADYIIQYLEI